ncbi:MAG TPA: sodium:solute symporter family protein [Vicinamibacterales bacterium]|nr:sodium:solute symporter family protein [Vicinamibacterales bacterium]
MLLTVLLILFSLGLIVLGSWVGRTVRGTADFFVAGRSLGPGLLFATFLAANIGASSTVGATGHAYRDGLAAWWWNGSAGLGTLILAFWVGPRIWREAEAHGILTVGDFLEHHFGREVRAVAALVIWASSFLILCGQLKGAAIVLKGVTGLPFAVGAFLSMVVTVAYFILGGLKSAAYVNAVQLVVMMAGFLIAAPFAANSGGGWFVSGFDSSFWSGSKVGWSAFLLLGPAFFLSPGLLQRAFGAKSPEALTRGVALSGIALLFFAWMPVVLGMAARSLHPDLQDVELALPAILADGVPKAVGSLALAAVLYAELSSADAVLMMLATSGARDFYRGFLRPSATDGHVLGVARALAVAGGLIGFGLTFYFDTVVGAIQLFYQVMIVTLFAPILGALVLPRTGRWTALTAMLVGVGTLVTTMLATGGEGLGWAPPHFLGLIASAITFFILAAF